MCKGGIWIFYGLIFLKTIVDGKKPNVVIIIADDLGWNDVSFHGSNEIPTPTLDSLAYHGIVLNRFYTQQTCTPSRAALLTGNYPIRSGYQGNPLKGGEYRTLPPNMTTMPQHFKNLGYNTYLVGKWHLGHPLRSSTPLGKGYDYHLGYWNGYVGYFDKQIRQNDFLGFDFHENYKKASKQVSEGYATDIFTNKAKQIIANHKEEKSNPMFLVLSHLAVHAGKNGTELEVKNVDKTMKKFDYIKDPNRRLYAELVTTLDESVGEIILALNDANILNNTIILFMSDNGAETIGEHKNYGSNWPFKGMKYTLFEGGIRGTAVLYYKKLIDTLHKSNNVGNNIFDDLMHLVDILPTFYAMAGGNNTNLGIIDGMDMSQALFGNKEKINDLKNRNILVNTDRELNRSAILGHGGRYKLVKGAYLNGEFTGHLGNCGRENTNPSYNINGILSSKVNCVLTKSTGRILTLEEITLKRNLLDINEQKCKRSTAEIPSTKKCADGCLFNLFEDPCEMNDLKEKYPKIVKELEKELQAFEVVVVKQLSHKVDINSNPAFCDNVWHTWLETDNKCNY